MKVWLVDLCNEEETFFTTMTICSNEIKEISGGIVLDNSVVMNFGKDLKLANIVQDKTIKL